MSPSVMRQPVAAATRLPVVSSRPCSAAASASSREADQVQRVREVGPRAGALVADGRDRDRLAQAGAALLDVAEQDERQPHGVERVGARAVAPAWVAASSAARAVGSTSLKRPCSIAILAWRERIRARSGLGRRPRAAARRRGSIAARASSARPSDHRARESSSSSPAARRGSRCSSTSPTACLQQRLGAAVGAVVDQRAARARARARCGRSPICSIASGTRAHRSSARSSSAPASPWACTRSAASAARTDATSASRWQPAER